MQMPILILACALLAAEDVETTIVLHSDQDQQKLAVLKNEIVAYLSDNGLKIPVFVIPEGRESRHVIGVMVNEVKASGQTSINIDIGRNDSTASLSVALAKDSKDYASDCRALIRSVLPIVLANKQVLDVVSALQGDVPEPASDSSPVSRPPTSPKQ